VVLLGDAAHTAHYTLGSGTKLALEDAIALADALASHPQVSDAFAAYEATRRPPVERFKHLAARSQGWWDSYRWRAGWSIERQALSYMTRSGNLTVPDYAGEEPEAARAALAWLGADVPECAADLDGWILSRPYRGRALTAATRRLAPADLTGADYRTMSDPDAWGETADTLVEERSRRSGVPLVLRGADDPVSLGARFDLAERLRLDGVADVAVELAASHLAQGAAAVAAGRTDVVVVR
jgi:anthraniloyl-CoA monooxygenase